MKNVTKSPAKATKTTTKIVSVVKTKKANNKVTKVSYLKEGVTGKQMMRAIFDANNRHKQDLGTFSQCLKRAIQFGQSELEATISKFDIKDCTPMKLIPLRSEHNKGKDKFSVYEVLMLIKKYYQK